MILAALSSVTAQDCQMWMKDLTTLRVESSLRAQEIDEGEIALAKEVAASTRALLRVSCFEHLGIGAPMIMGTCGGVSTCRYHI